MYNKGTGDWSEKNDCSRFVTYMVHSVPISCNNGVLGHAGSGLQYSTDNRKI